MKIEYRGKSRHPRYPGERIRHAYIWFDDEDERESKMAESVFSFLTCPVCEFKGWIDCGIMGFEVEDREEYELLKSFYKKGKKIAANSVKYGFIQL